jgi:hypothetical protein
MTKSIHAYKGGAVRHRSSAFHINLTDNSEQSNNHYTNLRHESNNRLPTISAEAAAKLTKELRARRLSAALTTTHPFIMASPESSSGEEPKKNLEQITFRFCSEW